MIFYYILVLLLVIWGFRSNKEYFSSGPGSFDQLKSMSPELEISKKSFRGNNTDFCLSPFKPCDF